MIGSGWGEMNIGVAVGILVGNGVRIGVGRSVGVTGVAVLKAWGVRAMGLGMSVGFGSGVRNGIGVAVEIFASGSCVAVTGWELGVTHSFGSASTTGVVQPITIASKASMPTMCRDFGKLIRKR